MLSNIAKTSFGAQNPVFGRLSFTRSSIRYASLTSAIGRGIRRSQHVRPPTAEGGQGRSRREDSRISSNGRAAKDGRRPLRNDFDRDEFVQGRTRREDSRISSNGRGIRRSEQVRPPTAEGGPGRSHREDFRISPEGRAAKEGRRPLRNDFDKDEFVRSGKFRGIPRDLQDRGPRKPREREPRSNMHSASSGEIISSKTKSRAHRVTDSMPERVKENVKVPESIPYSSPASEFIYGTSAVEAALRCGKRKVYKLYLYQRAGEDLGPTKIALRKLALSKNIEIKLAFAGWDRLLDKMSAGRPHNGCVLEASPLPRLPVRGFHAVPGISESHFRVELAAQSREEAAVNGTNDRVPILHPSDPSSGQQTHRYPVALLLDGVVDSGNIGAIIRSAYYLGIDAIIFAGRQSAPLSPVTIKASAGAAENMTLLHAQNEVDFIKRSKENGWRFYAADAPGPGATYLDRAMADGETLLPTMHSPSVIMMGSEATGLNSHIKSHADSIVSIPGARHSAHLGVESDPARIDSLNVSVAAALLMEMFLRTPLAMSEPVKKSKDRVW